MHLRLLASTSLTFILLLAAPAAHAAEYWWNASSSMMTPRNGFAWYGDAALFNYWGTRCENRAATFPANAACSLVWSVPAGLDAAAGASQGSYRHANPNFQLQLFVHENGNSILRGDTSTKSFNRQWADMGGYVQYTMNPTATTTPSVGTNWFDVTALQVLINDPSSPAVSTLSGHTGWKGPSGTCITYGFSDAGSQMQATSLVNLSTGQGMHGWNPGGGDLTSGHPSIVHAPCFAAPGNGVYTYRIAGSDKAGNNTVHDFAVSFDTAPPEISPISSAGVAIADGHAFLGSATGYRPPFHTQYQDGAGSGVASAQIWVDGHHLAYGSDWTSVGKMTPGVHHISWRVIDAVGNITDTTRMFTVVDDVQPVLSIASPRASGGNEVRLEVSATDDMTGVNPATWSATVNGQPVSVSGTTGGMSADLGFLVDGTHELVVKVRDAAGNEAVQTIEYIADGGDLVPQLPKGFLTGIFLFDSPATVKEGEAHRVRAMLVRNGRPVPGKVELRRGASVVVGATIQRDSVADLSFVGDGAGPLALHGPEGSDLTPVSFSYDYVRRPEPVAPDCSARPAPTSCPAPTPSETPAPAPAPAPVPAPIIVVPSPVIAGSGAGAAGSAGAAAQAVPAKVGALPSFVPTSALGGWPRNVVYYVANVPYWNGVPLAESGARLDAVAPSWKLRLIQTRRGTVRTTRKLTFSLWTSELSVVHITPIGSERRTTASARRSSRTIKVAIGRRTPLGRTLQRARPGQVLRVRIRMQAIDKRGNRSRPKAVTFRVRV